MGKKFVTDAIVDACPLVREALTRILAGGNGIVSMSVYDTAQGPITVEVGCVRGNAFFDHWRPDSDPDPATVADPTWDHVRRETVHAIRGAWKSVQADRSTGSRWGAIYGTARGHWLSVVIDATPGDQRVASLRVPAVVGA